MLNQPANPQTRLDAKELREIAQHPQVFIEQTALTYLLGYQTEEDFKEVMTHLPQVIYSSDLGQISQMDIDAFMQQSKEYFKNFGLSEARTALISQKSIKYACFLISDFLIYAHLQFFIRQVRMVPLLTL